MKEWNIEAEAWIPLHPENQWYSGYHISQQIATWIRLLPPEDPNSIEAKRALYLPRRFMNEVLGVFFRGLAKPLIAQDVLNCRILDMDLMERLEPPYDSYMGVDWGGGQSAQTVVWIMAETDAGNWRLIHLQRFAQMDYLAQVETVANLISLYNVRQAVADMGFGAVQVGELQRRFGARVLGCYYVRRPEKRLDRPTKDESGRSIMQDYVIADKVTIIESYTYQRNDGTRTITPENNRDNGDWIRDQDKKFLNDSGLEDLFRKYDVEYVNLTEEVWSNRVARSEDVRKCVEAEFSPVKAKQLYGQIPQLIFNLRGKKLISYAKIKIHHSRVFRISGTLKNIFGNIVDPDRHNYHGQKDNDLSQSIIDINKIYGALFQTVGLTEAIYTAVRYTKDGTYALPWDFRYDLIESLGLAICGDSLVSVDAFVSQLCGLDPARIEHLKLAAEVFGKWPQDVVEQAKRLRTERYHTL